MAPVASNLNHPSSQQYTVNSSALVLLWNKDYVCEMPSGMWRSLIWGICTDFQRKTLPLPTVMLRAADYDGDLVRMYQTAWGHIPEDINLVDYVCFDRFVLYGTTGWCSSWSCAFRISEMFTHTRQYKRSRNAATSREIFEHKNLLFPQ